MVKKIAYTLLAIAFVIPYASLFSRAVRARGPIHRYESCKVTGESKQYHLVGLMSQGEIVVPKFNFYSYTLEMDCKGEKAGMDTINSRDEYEFEGVKKRSPKNGCEVGYGTVPESLYIFGIKVYSDNDGFYDLGWSGDCDEPLNASH